MNDFWKKTFGLLIILFSIEKNLDVFSMENSENKQYLVLKENIKMIESEIWTVLHTARNAIYAYNDISDRLKELMLFPMFFDISKSKFPRQIIYFEPDSNSRELMDRISSLSEFVNSLYNKISDMFDKFPNVLKLISKSDVNAPNSKLEDLFPTFPAPISVISITSAEKINFSYDLCKFRNFTNSMESDTNFLTNVISFSKLLGLLYDHTLRTKKDFRAFCFFVNDIYNSKNEINEFKIKDMHSLFESIYSISNLLVDSFSATNFLRKIPSNLSKIFNRLSLEKLKRSNFMVEFFGEYKNFGYSLVKMPDITPVLISIKENLNLKSTEESMALFSYANNLQLIIPPIDHGYTLEFLYAVFNSIDDSRPLGIIPHD